MHKTFRPKGTSVKAIQVAGEEAFKYAVDWCAGQETTTSPEGNVPVPAIKVPTLEGVKLALVGDYIVRVNGQGFKVMSAEEFEDRYEPVRTTRSEN